MKKNINFSFFGKKNVFFSKKFFSKFPKLFRPWKLYEIFFFENKFPKKTFFFKKAKFLFMGVKNFFLPKQLFLSKTKCPLYCPFSKMKVFVFALQTQSLSGLSPSPTVVKKKMCFQHISCNKSNKFVHGNK